MLAAEVLIEAAERLARAVHHLLDGEVLARTGIEELGGGVEKALYPGFGPEPGGIERPRHRLLPPTETLGLHLVGRHLVLCHWRKATRIWNTR